MKLIIFKTLLLYSLLLVGNPTFSQETLHPTKTVSKQTFVYADTLKLDFYSSKAVITANRPLLVLVHGGGFSSGKRDNPLEVEFSKKMASQGYAVASISYSLTRKGKSFGCDCPSEEKIKTFVAAAEDVSKALGFLKANRKQLAFNPGKIVLIGSSAGAEAVLNYAFLAKHKQFKHIKRHDIAAVVSFAGAILNAGLISKNNALPMLFFHEKKDNLVPFTTAPHHFCQPTDTGYLMLDGPETIAKKLKELNTPYVLAVDENGNHDWANTAYKKTDLVTTFIEEAVMKGKLVTKEIDLSIHPSHTQY